MTSVKPVVRLHLFFATENATAVILRQGPTEVFRLILWDRETDTFLDGQWLKQKVYVDRCDLSPDGRHFLYFTLNGDWSGEAEGAYTVLSRPPFFTALALFPEGSTWGGGGTFLSSSEYFASGGEDIIGRTSDLTRLSVVRDNTGTLCLRDSQGRRRPHDPDSIKADPKPSRIHAIDQYDTQGGVLYRRDGLDLHPIRDFTDMNFEPMRAPYDWREPETPRGRPT